MATNNSGFAVHHLKDGVLHTVLPGEQFPAWATITNPYLAGGKEPDADPATGDSAPPQAGAGSGRDVWAAYAEQHGVKVEDGWKRDHIIAACEEAGAPVE